MQDKRPKGLGLGEDPKGSILVVKNFVQFIPLAKIGEEFETMLQYLVEKIHFKHVPPPTTSQTIAKPLLESQSHLAPRNGGEEETRKKE